MNKAPPVWKKSFSCNDYHFTIPPFMIWQQIGEIFIWTRAGLDCITCMGFTFIVSSGAVVPRLS